MSSEIDICNLALSHIGDSATVASLDPPEGSAQAEHCARFYPMARDALLEMHTWGFATRRVQLALLGSNYPEWDYAYAQPADSLNILAVLPPGALDDYTDHLNVPFPSIARAVPQPYSCEVDDAGNQVIYTDQPDAVLRYTSLVTDTTRFTPLFVNCLAWQLASMLAGPVLKGDAGAAEAKRCAAMALTYLTQAKESDANQRKITPQHTPSFIAGR